MIEAKQCDERDIVPEDFGLRNCYLSRENTTSDDQAQFNFLTSRVRASLSGRTGPPSIVQWCM